VSNGVDPLYVSNLIVGKSLTPKALADVRLADATGQTVVAEVTEVTGAADVAEETVGYPKWLPSDRES